MNRMVTFALFLGIVLLSSVDSQNTVGDVAVTVKAAQDIAALAKAMQADINSKDKSYQNMGKIINQVAIIVSNTDVDSEKSKLRQSNGLTIAGGIVSSIGGIFTKFGGG